MKKRLAATVPFWVVIGILAWIVWVLTIGLVSGFTIGVKEIIFGPSNLKTESQKTSTLPQLDAARLISEHDKHRGRVVQVTGWYNHVNGDPAGENYIDINPQPVENPGYEAKNSYKGTSIHCYVEEIYAANVMMFVRGKQKIKVEGTVGDIAYGGVQITGCELIESRVK